MGKSARQAKRYEEMHPGTGVSEAQAAERMDRIDHRTDRRTHRRTGRTAGIVVPELPWLEKERE